MDNNVEELNSTLNNYIQILCKQFEFMVYDFSILRYNEYAFKNNLYKKSNLGSSIVIGRYAVITCVLAITSFYGHRTENKSDAISASTVLHRILNSKSANNNLKQRARKIDEDFGDIIDDMKNPEHPIRFARDNFFVHNIDKPTECARKIFPDLLPAIQKAGKIVSRLNDLIESGELDVLEIISKAIDDSRAMLTPHIKPGKLNIEIVIKNDEFLKLIPLVL